ncbi:MAG: hypothetical protein HPY69_05510 [Armatimonadetes bacterium]|nr:hypothetical protein [Armatimonadota bacterium]
MHDLVALDADLRPLTSCWTLFDRRAEESAAEVQRRLPPGEAYRRTGGQLEGYTPAAKITWLREHEPKLFAATRLFVAPKDALRIMLGGEPVTDPLDAAGTLLWNLEARAWDETLLAAIGARAEQLPEVREPWAEAGRLSSEAAEAFGLPQGLPLVVGAGDDIEVIAAGVVAPGQALEHIGTTGTILVCTDVAAYDPEELVDLYPHPIAGRYLLGGTTNAAGRSLDWAARLLAGMGDAGRLPLDYPPSDRPEPPLYLPCIKGERGLLWSAGATGAFCGLREEHGAADLALAVYEGVALSLKEIIAAAAALGATPQSIVSGTPLDDRSWAQLRADCYGLRLEGLASADLTGLGAAMLALVNQGVYGSVEQAVVGCCRSGESVSPDPARAAEYERRLARYLSVARA